jgi:hypothetical protein
MEHLELPPMVPDIVAKNVDGAIGVADLEVSMVGREPPVEDLGDLDEGIAEPEATRRLLAAVSRMAFDVNRERCRSVHGVSITSAAGAAAGARPAPAASGKRRRYSTNL